MARSSEFTAQLGSLAQANDEKARALREEDALTDAKNVRNTTEQAIIAAGKYNIRGGSKEEVARNITRTASQRRSMRPTPWGPLAVFNTAATVKQSQEQAALQGLSDNAARAELAGQRGPLGRPARRSAPGVAVDVAPYPKPSQSSVGVAVEDTAERALQGRLPVSHILGVHLRQGADGKLFVPGLSTPQVTYADVARMLDEGTAYEHYDPQHLRDYWDMHHDLVSRMARYEQPHDMLMRLKAKNPAAVIPGQLVSAAKLGPGSQWISPIPREDGESVEQAVLKHHRVMSLSAIVAAVHAGRSDLPISLSGGYALSRGERLPPVHDAANVGVTAQQVRETLNMPGVRHRFLRYGISDDDVRTLSNAARDTLNAASGRGVSSLDGVRVNGSQVRVGGGQFEVIGREIRPVEQINGSEEQASPDEVQSSLVSKVGTKRPRIKDHPVVQDLAAKYRRQ